MDIADLPFTDAFEEQDVIICTIEMVAWTLVFTANCLGYLSHIINSKVCPLSIAGRQRWTSQLPIWRRIRRRWSCLFRVGSTSTKQRRTLHACSAFSVHPYQFIPCLDRRQHTMNILLTTVTVNLCYDGKIQILWNIMLYTCVLFLTQCCYWESKKGPQTMHCFRCHFVTTWS